MKNIYLLFIYALLFLASCETNNKKPELTTTNKSIVVDKDTCWITYVLIVNLPDLNFRYNKKYFRKALAYSIDRKKLFDELTRWTPHNYPLDSNGNYFGGPGIHGIVPPAFPEYDINSITGYSLDVDSAKYYLEKSKFPKNTELKCYYFPDHTFIDYSPDIEISLGWNKKIGLAYLERICVTTSSRNKQAFSGEEGIYLIPITKHNLPKEYLSLFYSKNVLPNPYTDNGEQAYKSSVFDSYYEAGLLASDRVDAINNFKAAEKVLIDDAIIIPLMYSIY